MSAASYAVAFAQERGVPIRETLLDTFYRMHCIDGVYTDPKSAHIAAEVDRIAEERSQPLPDGTEPPPVDRYWIYLEVAVRADKCRVFGLGSLYSGSQVPTRSSSFDSSTSSYAHASLMRLLELEQQLRA